MEIKCAYQPTASLQPFWQKRLKTGGPIMALQASLNDGAFIMQGSAGKVTITDSLHIKTRNTSATTSNQLKNWNPKKN